MTTYIELLFWISILTVGYTYVGYGLVLYAINVLRRPTKMPVLSEDDLPDVTHVIAAYNEQDIIDAKLRNSLELVYPAHKLTTIVVTDGSSDATASIVAQHPDVIHLHSDARKGKLHAVNRALKHVSSPITIFSDANAMLNSTAVRAMVHHFQNNRVGAVAGEKIVESDVTDDASSSGEGLYWKYESFLKKHDYRLYSVVGAAGELFAIRTHLYETPGSEMLIEDFVTSMRIAAKGYRVAYAPEARASERASASIYDEMKRKVRIAAGGLQASWSLRGLLNPVKYPVLSFQLLSHRVLRWTLAPLALIILLISSGFLTLQGSAFYLAMLVLQLVFYGLAAIGFQMEKRKIKWKFLFVPFYFTFMNTSVFLGLIKLVSGDYSVLWEKAARK